MKLSVILPAKNEERLIEETLKDISSFVGKKKYRFEIIVVLNGCTDNTKEIVKSLIHKNKNIKLITSKPGYGHALKRGLGVAKGEYVVIYNVDFYDLNLINLISIDLYGKDLIIGSKRAPWSIDDRKSILRKMVTFLFNYYLKIFHGFKGSDTHGIKAIKGSVVKKILPKCKTNSGIFDTELVIRIQREDGEIADFPVVLEEKRPSRFTKRLLDTPIDIYNLQKALKS